MEVDCCVVGGGPAGVMAGLLFARAGCRTVVLEKHGDFLRDFRGDTVHPSTMEVLSELGMLEAFLERPHQRMTSLVGRFGGESVRLADFDGLEARCPFVAFMPQWHFLDFLSGEARKMESFSLRMCHEVTDLVVGDGVVKGVRAEAPEGSLEVRARLVVGADGRGSRVRDRAGLAVREIGAPIDVLWFRVPREAGAGSHALLNAGAGHVLVTIDRGDYWQCAFVIPKGGAHAVRERGLEAFRAAVEATVPGLAEAMEALVSFEDVRLLTVAVDRLEQWSRPGLVMIGDAAHAMSPIGGVGINLAIQDAVAAGNLLAEKLRDGEVVAGDLQAVRRRRLFPTRVTQWVQVQAQNRILAPIIIGRTTAPEAPLLFRLIDRVPFLQKWMAAAVGLGARPEHVGD